jgi:hypothetical protein
MAKGSGGFGKTPPVHSPKEGTKPVLPKGGGGKRTSKGCM